MASTSPRAKTEAMEELSLLAGTVHRDCQAQDYETSFNVRVFHCHAAFFIDFWCRAANPVGVIPLSEPCGRSWLYSWSH
jgi:hypothetical protein